MYYFSDSQFLFLHIKHSLPYTLLCSFPSFLFFLSFFLFLFLAMPCNMWDLSSLTRDKNLCPWQWQRGVLTTGLPGKSLNSFLNIILWRFFRISKNTWLNYYYMKKVSTCLFYSTPPLLSPKQTHLPLNAAHYVGFPRHFFIPLQPGKIQESKQP